MSPRGQPRGENPRRQRRGETPGDDAEGSARRGSGMLEGGRMNGRRLRSARGTRVARTGEEFEGVQKDRKEAVARGRGRGRMGAPLSASSTDTVSGRTDTRRTDTPRGPIVSPEALSAAPNFGPILAGASLRIPIEDGAQNGTDLQWVSYPGQALGAVSEVRDGYIYTSGNMSVMALGTSSPYLSVDAGANTPPGRYVFLVNGDPVVIEVAATPPSPTPEVIGRAELMGTVSAGSAQTINITEGSAGGVSAECVSCPAGGQRGRIENGNGYIFAGNLGLSFYATPPSFYANAANDAAPGDYIFMINGRPPLKKIVVTPRPNNRAEIAAVNLGARQFATENGPPVVVPIRPPTGDFVYRTGGIGDYVALLPGETVTLPNGVTINRPPAAVGSPTGNIVFTPGPNSNGAEIQYRVGAATTPLSLTVYHNTESVREAMNTLPGILRRVFDLMRTRINAAWSTEAGASPEQLVFRNAMLARQNALAVLVYDFAQRALTIPRSDTEYMQYWEWMRVTHAGLEPIGKAWAEAERDYMRSGQEDPENQAAFTNALALVSGKTLATGNPFADYRDAMRTSAGSTGIPSRMQGNSTTTNLRVRQRSARVAAPAPASAATAPSLQEQYAQSILKQNAAQVEINSKVIVNRTSTASASQANEQFLKMLLPIDRNGTTAAAPASRERRDIKGETLEHLGSLANFLEQLHASSGVVASQEMLRPYNERSNVPELIFRRPAFRLREEIGRIRGALAAPSAVLTEPLMKRILDASTETRTLHSNARRTPSIHPRPPLAQFPDTL